MKKLLALVLAMVMTLGLATVGASAAAYTDAADIDYTEAVDVMSALKVLDGQNGAFNPNGVLTREQGAKIIAYMILGKTVADSLTTAKSSFADVQPERWSAGAIEYCVSTKIIGGAGKDANGNDVFNPEAELTGYAFAKMCLVALGYNPNYENFVGGDWAINVAKVAADAGLNKDLTSLVMSTGITREQAAQMALNTLKGTMVDYDNPTEVRGENITVITGADRKQVNNIYNTNYTTPVTTQDASFTQFVERYFSDPALKLYTNQTDDNGRPANEWKLGNISVGKYAKTPTLTYTAGVKGGTLYTDLGKPSFSNSWTITKSRDGADVYTGDADVDPSATMIIKSGNTTTLAGSGAGMKTEVFYNAANSTLDIVQTGTYLAKAMADYNTSTGKLTVAVDSSVGTMMADISTISGADFPVVESVRKDGYLYLTVGRDNGKYVVKTVEVVPATAILPAVSVSSYKAGDYVTAGGTKYTVAKVAADYSVYVAGGNRTATYVGNSSNAAEWEIGSTTYDLILDTYGNVLGASLNTAGTTNSGKYLFLTEVGSYNVGAVPAKAVFMDGTTATITIGKVKVANETAVNGTVDTDSEAVVDGKPGANVFYSYKKASDGSYTLTYVNTYAVGYSVAFPAKDATAISQADTKVEINANNYVSTGVTLDSKTAMVFGTGSNTSAYVGVANFPKSSSPATVYFTNEANTAVKAVYTATTAAASDSTGYVYVFSGYGTSKDGDDTIYTYKVFRNGAIEENVESTYVMSYSKGGLYKVNYDSKGRLVLDSSTYQVGTAVSKTGMTDGSGITVSNGNIRINGNAYLLNSSVEYYLIDTYTTGDSAVVSEGVITTLPVGNYRVRIFETSGTDSSINKVWVIKVAG